MNGIDVVLAVSDSMRQAILGGALLVGLGIILAAWVLGSHILRAAEEVFIVVDWRSENDEDDNEEQP